MGGVPGLGGCTWSRGVYLVSGVYLVPWGYLVRGSVPGLGGIPGPAGCVPGPGGCTWSRGGTWSWGSVPGQVLPPVNRSTHTCKNITLPQLRCGQ